MESEEEFYGRVAFESHGDPYALWSNIPESSKESWIHTAKVVREAKYESPEERLAARLTPLLLKNIHRPTRDIAMVLAKEALKP